MTENAIAGRRQLPTVGRATCQSPLQAHGRRAGRPSHGDKHDVVEPLAVNTHTLNILIAAVSLTTTAALLWCASHAPSWGWLLLAAWAFSYVNNTNFSLLHEAVHGIFHPDRRVNDWAGRIMATTFPTAFQFQRQCHLGHHARNRSPVEQFDYIRPSDNKLWKYLQWYTILTGLYWFYVVLGWLLFLICPWVYRLRLFDGTHSRIAAQSSVDAMLDSMFAGAPVAMRLEMLFTLLVQAAVFLALDLSVAGWLCCYAAFAIRWSGLQYADHAWSGLDVHDGAWNLRVTPPVRWIFLNYHHHKAHHQHPTVPWRHLPAYVDPREPQPSYLSIYARMWLGPRPFPTGGGAAAGDVEP